MNEYTAKQNMANEGYVTVHEGSCSEACGSHCADPPPIETVNHPPHYNHGKIEAIVVVEDWNLGFCLGNAVKYIARAGHKGPAAEDLKKAAWYLNREIERLSK